MIKVIDLIPMLHEGDGALPSLFAEEFVLSYLRSKLSYIHIHWFLGRCEQLGCQPLALEVFGNYAKYNITLAPNVGRWLINSKIIFVRNCMVFLKNSVSLFNASPMLFSELISC